MIDTKAQPKTDRELAIWVRRLLLLVVSQIERQYDLPRTGRL